MAVKFCKEPWLDKPDMLVSWPGIGNVGLIAIDTLRAELQAEELGEIEPWDFFYPRTVIIEKGELKDMVFPSNKFYYKRLDRKDLLFFIGEEQPTEGRGAYAEGRKAYGLANLVLDVAQKYDCRRIYTSGAAIAPMHHTMKSRVWVAPNSADLADEVREYENAVLMGDIEGMSGQGSITGLNGLLLGVARARGFKGMCLMGEVPIYLQGLSMPYPKASKSVLEVLTDNLGVKIETKIIDDMVERTEKALDELYQQLPPEVKTELDKLKLAAYAKPSEAGEITEEDKRKIMEHIDELFKRGRTDEEKPS